MIELRPFRAIHYDPARVDLADVIAPPYDVIDDRTLERLYARSPHNVVRLILNRSADRYGAAASELAAWRRGGVLAQDPTPSLYYYVQDFRLPDGSDRQRSGLIAAVRLEPFSAGNILPHERTFASAKADRLKLMTACRANLSAIFGVYPHGVETVAPAREHAAQRPPWIDVTADGERHRVWRISDAETIAQLLGRLRTITVFIADGHHRYETALTYRDRRRSAGDEDSDAPHNFVMMYLCAMDDPGLVILPTHRVWGGPLPAEWGARIAEHFEVDPTDPSGSPTRDGVDGQPGNVALRTRDGGALLRLRGSGLAAVDRVLAGMHPVIRHLDVTILDAFLLGHVLGIDCARAGQDGALTYTHDEREAVEAVARGAATAAFLVRAPRMAEVEAACLAGQTMPQKSTYFFPKLQTGLVFHLLDGEG
jgi:uncharacterized protein (DUF1015 family)